MSLSGAVSDDAGLLRAAARGDEQAFAELVSRHEAALRAHCYRMLGSLPDAEDALQETMVRAWRGLAGFQGRSSVRSWLYAIATNAALDASRHRSRRELPAGFGPSAGPGDDLAPALSDPVWLGPFPDRLLPPESAPDARYEQRESIEVAFLIALQSLPPAQRAVFLLREVLAFSAADIAGQLGMSVPAVTSALQRARGRISRQLPDRSQQATLAALGDARTAEVVTRYADALENGDAETLISMLTSDATWSMPPIPTWFAGHDRIREFLLRWPLTCRWRHVPVRCNGQLAVACYLFEGDLGEYVPAVVDVLTLAGDRISAVTAFLGPDDTGAGALSGRELSAAGIFARLGLPARPE